ncbi:MAG: response regulator transcription factor, partial [Anaerolineae bacterium]|nr:response regulator transcription factor [Anaerolineae bacterium]
MSPQYQLLLVEHDPNYLPILVRLLERHGYRVRSTRSGLDALRDLERRTPDLMLLDINLPDINGLDLLHRIRTLSNVPIVVLSAQTDERGKVRSLEAGADDFITKPFHDAELLARIGALMRRVSWTPTSDPLLEVGGLRVDIARRYVTLNSRPLHLTPIEYAILCTMMQRVGQIVTHEELLHSVWGPGYGGDYSVLRVNISRLRQKIEENPRRPTCILTIPRQGYKMPEEVGHGA